MPHCIIEYASDLTNQVSQYKMIQASLQAMQASGLFETDDIKIRTKDYAYFQCGNSSKSFIHITLKILSGRNTQQKKHLATLVINAMGELALSDIEITIDVQEMDAESYIKIRS